MLRLLRPAKYYWQFAGALRAAHRYSRHADPEAAVRAQLLHREAAFLDLLRRVVFSNPTHPLHAMLDEARCSLGDIESMVAAIGLEPTLDKLRIAGVRVSQEEFKGRAAIVRGGKHIPASTADFVNPLVNALWRSESSGSTGRPVSVPASLESAAYREFHHALALRQLGAGERHWISMSPILPSPHGLTRPIWNFKNGYAIQSWYAARGTSPESRYYRFVTRALLGELRLLGVPAPPLQFLPQNDFLPVAREIAKARARGKLSFVTGAASSCVRVASAALDRGVDISGTRFWTAGEGLSRAKAAIIRQAGAEAYATYWSSELGSVGFSCQYYEGQNTVHHFRDNLAIVTSREKAAGVGEVNAMYFTTLLSFAPFFVINLDLGDHGIIEPAKCQCGFSKVGFDTVISDIFSYAKVTGHGITLAGTEIVRILEEALPARFGGGPCDYQLMEQEAAGQTRMALRVNPRIGKIERDKVETFFLTEVRKLYGGSLTAAVWSQAGTLEILAEAPVVGRTGKILPLHLLGGSSSPAKTEEGHAA